ncbi:MAG: FtsX-like permease family protein [Dehalococcoidia bacterium]
MGVPVARRNLFAEKGRFAISVAGVGFAVLLILIVLALYRGFSRSGQTFKDLPGQLWIVQQGTTDPFHSISLVSRVELEDAQTVDGIAAVVPVLSRTQEFTVNGKTESGRLIALDIDSSLPLPDETRRRFLPSEGTIVIDGILSDKTGLSSNETAEFNGVRLVVGHVEPASSEAFTPFIFLNATDATRIFARDDLVSYGMVILQPGAESGGVAQAIQARNPNVQVFTSNEFATSIRKEIDESFLPIITVLLVIGFVVGAAVVGLTIYTATIERSREFGVMKAVGGSAGFLYRIVLSQSSMLTAAGFVIGLVAAWSVAQLVRELVPDFVTIFRAQDVIAVFGGTVLMALVASFVPVRRINSIDPAIVFRA